MKNSTKLAIAITAAIVLFTSGYFFGKTSSREITVTQNLSLSSSTAEQDTEESEYLISEESVTQDEKININTASAEELTALQGIGETLSERIVEYRETNGDFSSIEDVMNVNGIGESRFFSIKDYITVGD